MCIGCRVRKHVVACQSWWCILRSSVFFKFFPLGITRLQRRLSCSAWQNQFMMSCKHEHLSVFSSQKSPKATCVYVQDTKTGVAGRNHESCLLGEKEDVVWWTGSVNKTYYCSYYFNRDDETPLTFLANELLQLKPWSLPTPWKSHLCAWTWWSAIWKDLSI